MSRFRLAKENKMAAANVKVWMLVRRKAQMFYRCNPKRLLFRQVSTDTYTDEEKELIERLKRLRDASGLDDYQKNRLYGIMPHTSITTPSEMKSRKIPQRRYQRHLYAIYGMSSGQILYLHISH